MECDDQGGRLRFKKAWGIAGIVWLLRRSLILETARVKCQLTKVYAYATWAQCLPEPCSLKYLLFGVLGDSGHTQLCSLWAWEFFYLSETPQNIFLCGISQACWKHGKQPQYSNPYWQRTRLCAFKTFWVSHQKDVCIKHPFRIVFLGTIVISGSWVLPRFIHLMVTVLGSQTPGPLVAQICSWPLMAGLSFRATKLYFLCLHLWFASISGISPPLTCPPRESLFHQNSRLDLKLVRAVGFSWG